MKSLRNSNIITDNCIISNVSLEKNEAEVLFTAHKVTVKTGNISILPG